MMENDIFYRHHLAQTTMFPLGIDIAYASGSYVYDRSGKGYLDMVSGIGVSSLGHQLPEIIEAVKKQLDLHLHVMVYGEFIQQAQINAAKALTSFLPDTLDCVYFVNSGTEAIEAALKLAKRVTGRKKIVSFNGAYHGSTHGALSVSGNEMKKYAFRPLLPNIHFIQLNHYEDLSVIDDSTACVILETIQGDAGIRIPDMAFMIALRSRCNETGTLLILDEIQCGFGRTGRFSAFDHFGIVPDILTLGKALGGGFPIGCVVSSTTHMRLFTSDPPLGHISTFAGHPVVCAAAAAALNYLSEHNIITTVDEKGAYIENRLKVHSVVKEIRRKGLYMAIDMESAEMVNEVVLQARERGLISFWFLSCPASFRLAPPLNIEKKELEIAMDILDEAIFSAIRKV
jgi:acetylornithine/succinyldiaminopimelate/putrescine aminotransferase